MAGRAHSHGRKPIYSRADSHTQSTLLASALQAASDNNAEGTKRDLCCDFFGLYILH